MLQLLQNYASSAFPKIVHRAGACRYGLNRSDILVLVSWLDVGPLLICSQKGVNIIRTFSPSTIQISDSHSALVYSPLTDYRLT